jgi:hypothetical protein
LGNRLYVCQSRVREITALAVPCCWLREKFSFRSDRFVNGWISFLDAKPICQTAGEIRVVPESGFHLLWPMS